MRTNIQQYCVLILVILCSFWIPEKTFANYTASTSPIKGFVPIGTEVAVFTLTITNTSTTSNMTLSHMKFSKTDGNFNFDQFDSIKVYQNTDEDSNFNESSNDLTAEQLTLGGDATTVSPSNDNTNKTINQGGEQKLFWIVFKLKDNTTLADTSGITFDKVTVCDDQNSCTPTTLTDPNYKSITATGIEVTYADNIAPSIIFPGSKNVPIAFFHIAAKGDNVNNLSLKITDTYGNFVGNQGVEKVVLSKDPSSRTINEVVPGNYSNATVQVIQEKDISSSDSVSESIITLNQWTNLTTLLTDELDPYNIWLAYDFGEDILVTADSKLNISITGKDDFFGFGEAEDSRTLTTPNENLTISFAGIEIADINQISGENSYDANTTIPALAFSLRAHQAVVTVNKITIVNNGSIPFFASSGPKVNIEKVKIYRDTGGGAYNTQDDILVGELELNGSDSEQTTKIAPIRLSIPNDDFPDVVLEAYDNNPNNVQTFFVVYDVASDIVSTDSTTKNYVTAEIGDITATGNSGSIDILFKASGASNTATLPLDSKPSIDLTETTIQIVETIDISPTTAFDGEIKVPMLYINFKSDTEVQTGKIKIKNSQANFYSKSTGITKVWVYEDKNSSQTLDDGDKFLRSVSQFPNPKEALLENIEFNHDNEFLILYDIGLLASEENKPFAAQIAENGLEIEGGSSTVSGVLPSIEVAQITAVNNPLKVVTIETVTDAITTFNIELSITNDSGLALNITEIKPKFYLSEKGGLDISYEFTTSVATVDGADSFILNHNDTKNINFNCSHTIPYSQGTVLIDAHVMYQKQVSPNQKISLQRYQDGLGDWSLIVNPDTHEREIISNMTSATIPPSYLVHPLKLCSSESSNTCENFLNGTSIGKNKILSLEFVDSSIIDESSIRLIRGNDILFQKEELDKAINSFTLDKTTNFLKFYVGETSADVSLSVEDLSGNEMSITNLSYLISESIDITNPVFYPNPHIFGSNNLNLGFSTSQDNTTIKLYIFNHLGQQVFYHTDIVQSGLNIISISDLWIDMAPGIFICRILSEEDGRIVSSKTAKLAIY
tara:strand:- start:1486 stop:4683 length:3198 start_codon:yes stop_codon:yes gene_type:complete